MPYHKYGVTTMSLQFLAQETAAAETRLRTGTNSRPGSVRQSGGILKHGTEAGRKLEWLVF